MLSERFEVISTSDNLFGVYFFKIKLCKRVINTLFYLTVGLRRKKGTKKEKIQVSGVLLSLSLSLLFSFSLA